MDRLKSSSNKIPSPNESLNVLLLGSWEMRDSFSFGIGVNTMVNSVEKYVFRSDGTGMHSYKDDSGLPTNNTHSTFIFEADDKRIVFRSNETFDDSVEIDFKIDGDKPALGFGGSEEVYTRSFDE